MPPENPLEYLELIKFNLSAVESRIQAACARSERDRKSVTLVAVSKFQPVEKIQAAYACGLRHFGENYAEEALEKQAGLAELSEIQWHMVGHIQSRKARMLSGRFTLVHSLDSNKLARLLAQNLPETCAQQDVLLQVNLADEGSKFGLAPAMETILMFVRELEQVPGLRLRGLMGMPPLTAEPESNRPFFIRLRELASQINQALGVPRLEYLSMGTSSDFEVAIEEGATHIRLGESLFGSRPPRKQAE